MEEEHEEEANTIADSLSESHNDSENRHLFNRRGQVNYDNFIDAILAGREKKSSVLVPSAGRQCRLQHPRRIFLDDDQFCSLLSEVNGQKS
eukprot:gene41224-50311_t